MVRSMHGCAELDDELGLCIARNNNFTDSSAVEMKYSKNIVMSLRSRIFPMGRKSSYDLGVLAC